MNTYAQLITCNITDEVLCLHNENNKLIKQCLDNFVRKNNISPKDFIVTGSSCASYMDYFIINEVRDIDVYFVGDIDISTIEKTDKIDVLSRINTSEGFEGRVIESDGYQFLPREDLLISMSLSFLLKNKRRSVLYLRLLLAWLNMNVNDFVALLKENISVMTNLDEKYKELALKNILIFEIKLSDYDLELLRKDIDFKTGES